MPRLVPPAWVRVLIPTVESEWRVISARACLLAARGCWFGTDPYGTALSKVDGLAREWIESDSFGIPPRVREPIGPLGLTAAEVAAWYPPPDLQDDREVLECQAWFQGMCNRFASGLLDAMTAHRVQSGLNKIVSHPTTAILVAAPWVPVRQLVRMVEGSTEGNLKAVEDSLEHGTQMSHAEINAWLESPVLKPALLLAAQARRPVPPGWWRAGGQPLVPTTTRQRQKAQPLP
jgi:hypothetical protein